MTVRLIARNFADNRTINAPKFTHVPSRNSRILTNFVEVCYHHFRSATIVEREKEMFFTHSCVRNCIDLSRVKTELSKKSFYPWHLHYSSGPGCSDVL